MLSPTLVVVVLMAGFPASLYLLWVLWSIHKAHGSAAWKFIFFGLTLLSVEFGMAIAIVFWPRSWMVPYLSSWFAVSMTMKAYTYAIGFTIWKGNVASLKNLARRRPPTLTTEEVHDLKGDK